METYKIVNTDQLLKKKRSIMSEKRKERMEGGRKIDIIIEREMLRNRESERGRERESEREKERQRSYTDMSDRDRDNLRRG